MELYMNLEATTSTGAADSGGLGFINANQAEIEMTLEIVPASSATDTTVSDAIRTKVKGRRKDRTKDKPQSIEVELRVIQDPSALRARTGDTGGCRSMDNI
jgi:hypothetical protein